MQLDEDWEFLLYYLVNGISIGINCYTIYQLTCIYRSHPRRLTRLPFYQHLSILGQQIATIPYLFQDDSRLCETATACYGYFGLMGIIITLIYTEVNRINLCDFHSSLSVIVVLLSQHWVILLLPLVSVIPLIFHHYRPSEDPWCSWNASNDRYLMLWEVFSFYLWIWLVLAYNVMVNLKVVYSLYQKPNPQLCQYYLWYLLFYSVIVYLSWLPRSFLRFFQLLLLPPSQPLSNTAHYLVFYPMYVANLVCCWISLSQVRSIHRSNRDEVSTDLPPSSVMNHSLLDESQSEDKEDRVEERDRSSSIFSLRWSEYSFFSDHTSNTNISNQRKRRDRGSSSSYLLERHHPSFLTSGGYRYSPLRSEALSNQHDFSFVTSSSEEETPR